MPSKASSQSAPASGSRLRYLIHWRHASRQWTMISPTTMPMMPSPSAGAGILKTSSQHGNGDIRNCKIGTLIKNRNTSFANSLHGVSDRRGRLCLLDGDRGDKAPSESKRIPLAHFRVEPRIQKLISLTGKLQFGLQIFAKKVFLLTQVYPLRRIKTSVTLFCHRQDMSHPHRSIRSTHSRA